MAKRATVGASKTGRRGLTSSNGLPATKSKDRDPSNPVSIAATYFKQNSKSKTYIGHKKKVHTLDWNCSGQKLASGSADYTIRVRQLDRQGASSNEVELKGHSNSVDILRFHPKNPDVLGTASADKTVRIWDTRAGKSCHGIETKGQNINLAWKPDGNSIAVGSKDNKLTVIDTKTLKPIIRSTKQFPYEINEMAFNHTGEYLLVTTGKGTVEIFKFPSMVEVPHSAVQAHSSHCYCIEFDPKMRYLATGGADALVSLWDISEMVCVRTFPRLDSQIRSLSFSHDGRFIASASGDQRIDISDVASGRSVHTIETREAMNCIVWNPKKMLLACAGDENHGRYAGSINVFGYSVH